jgi:hypothetical protein
MWSGERRTAWADDVDVVGVVIAPSCCPQCQDFVASSCCLQSAVTFPQYAILSCSGISWLNAL